MQILTWWKGVPESQQCHRGVQGAVSCLRSGVALLCLPWRGGDTAELLGNVLEELWDVQEQLRAPGGQAGDGVSLEPPPNSAQGWREPWD